MQIANIKYMKKSIAKNLSWLLLGTVIAKICGGVYRIILTRILGTDIGLYQMVFSIYSFLVILVSSGVPLAISKLISSSKPNRINKILYGAISIFFTASALLSLILLFGCKGVAALQGEKQVFLCYIILAPSLIFSAGTAIYKGYWQGVEKFYIPAAANIVEQVAKIVFGLAFMLILRKYYLLGALFGATLGTMLGDLASFAYLLIITRKRFQFKYSKKYLNDGRKVFKYSYQIMLYSLIVPFANLVDSVLIVKLLSVNFNKSASALLYGLQSGVVGSVLSIPSIFSFSLASVLMPSLSKNYADKEYDLFNEKVGLSFKLSIIVALPFAIFFIVFAPSIIGLLYGNKINGLGIDGQTVSSILLTISSAMVVFSCINQVSSVILQNLNKKNIPIINLTIGMVCKLIIELAFIPSRRLSIYAYAIAMVVGYVVSACLNLYAVIKYSKNMFDLKYVVKQTLVCLPLVVMLIIFKLLGSQIAFILGSIFSAIIYLIIIYLIKILNKKEIKFLFNNE